MKTNLNNGYYFRNKITNFDYGINHSNIKWGTIHVFFWNVLITSIAVILQKKKQIKKKPKLIVKIIEPKLKLTSITVILNPPHIINKDLTK